MTNYLWTDGTEARDMYLLKRVISNHITLNERELEECASKTYESVKSKHWQRTFPQKNFVFSVYYALDIKVIDIRAGLFFQSVDALYFALTHVDERNFANKIKYVFQAVYGHELLDDSAECIRIIRNNIMHTGSIEGNNFNPRAAEQLRGYIERMFNQEGQVVTFENNLMNFTARTTFMIGEMVTRVLGVKRDVLIRNGLPPSRSPLFCKEEDMKREVHDFVLPNTIDKNQ